MVCVYDENLRENVELLRGFTWIHVASRERILSCLVSCQRILSSLVVSRERMASLVSVEE